MKKVILVIAIALSLTVLRCTIAGKNTGSPIKYRARSGSVEGIVYYSYKYLCSLRDSVKKHNNAFPYSISFREITSEMKDEIISGQFPKGGYLYLNLNANSPEDFKKYHCELIGKNGEIFLSHFFQAQSMHNNAFSSVNMIGPGNPRYNGSNYGQTYVVSVRASYGEWFPVISDSIIANPFKVKVYRTKKSKKLLYRSYYVRTDSRKISIKY